MATPNPAYSFLNSIRYSFAEDLTSTDAGICMEHDHEQLKPQIISTWMPTGYGSKPGKRVIFAETQVSHRITEIFKWKLCRVRNVCCDVNISENFVDYIQHSN